MSDEFDAGALMAALDATEAAGVPTHLVEQLREMVRKKEAELARKADQERAAARALSRLRSMGPRPRGAPMLPSRPTSPPGAAPAGGTPMTQREEAGPRNPD